MTARDLKEILNGMASKSPDPSILNNAELLRRIRHRRRLHRLGVSSVAVAGTVVVGVAAVAVARSEWPNGQNSDVAAGSSSATQALTVGGCGSSVSPTSREKPSLVMTAELPDRISPDAQGWARGKVTITNKGDEPVEGIAAPMPDATVLQDGVVVSTPVGGRRLPGEVVLLQPGGSRTFDITIKLRRCGDGNALLEPGRYQLVVSQSLRFSNASGTGDDVIIQGGPWDFLVR